MGAGSQNLTANQEWIYSETEYILNIFCLNIWIYKLNIFCLEIIKAYQKLVNKLSKLIINAVRKLEYYKYLSVNKSINTWVSILENTFIVPENTYVVYENTWGNIYTKKWKTT